MGLVRNDFGELMVVPTLDYTGVPAGGSVDASCRVSGCTQPGHPEENVYHWVAGGWAPLDRYPVPFRLYPNHRADPLAYALPEPAEQDPSALGVGQTEDAAPTTPQAPVVRGESGPELATLPPGAAISPPTAEPAAAPAPAASASAAPEGEAK